MEAGAWRCTKSMREQKGGGIKIKIQRRKNNNNKWIHIYRYKIETGTTKQAGGEWAVDGAIIPTNLFVFKHRHLLLFNALLPFAF